MKLYTLRISLFLLSVCFGMAAQASPITVKIFNATAVCINQTDSFVSSVSGGTSPYTYSWRFGNGATSSSRNGAVIYTSGGTYTVSLKVVDAKGDSDSTSQSYTLLPSPVAVYSATLKSCGLAAFSASESGSSPASIASYLWTSAAPAGYSGMYVKGNTAVYQFTRGGKWGYKLVATSTKGCSAVYADTVNIKSFVTVSLPADTQVCTGTAVELNAVIGNAAKPYSISWDNSSSTSASFGVTVRKDTSLVVRIKDATGCSNYDSIKLHTLGPLLGNAGASRGLCFGQSTTLGTGAVAHHSYHWLSYPLSLFDSTSANPVVKPVKSTDYALTEYDSSTGCRDTGLVHITVLPLPDSRWFAAYSGQNTVFYATDSSYSDPSYLWNFGDGDSATGHEATHLYQGNKTYMVKLTVTGTNRCRNAFDSAINITVSGIGQSTACEARLQVYPVPFSDRVTVKYQLLQKSYIKISILDATGKELAILHDNTETGGNYSFEVNTKPYQLTSGMYYIRVSVNGNTAVKQVLKL